MQASVPQSVRSTGGDYFDFRGSQSSGTMLYHLRYQLYQLLGQAATHKILYVHPAHSALVHSLATDAPYIDNKHTAHLLKVLPQYLFSTNSVPTQYLLSTSTVLPQYFHSTSSVLTQC